jgi:hypothetical protein
MDKQYKSIKVELAVYKRADYIKELNRKPESKKKYTMSEIIDRGLDLINKEGMR